MTMARTGLLALAAVGPLLIAACSSRSSGGMIDLRKKGTVAVGDACVIASECAPSVEGEIACGLDSRICQLALPGRVGDAPCVGTRANEDNGNPLFYRNKPAARGFLCDRETGSYCPYDDGATCLATKPEGADCNNATECAYGLLCNFYVKRKCAPRAADGTGCGFDAECLERSYCDETSRTCVSGRALGSPCAQDPQCASHVCNGGVCAASRASL